MDAAAAAANDDAYDYENEPTDHRSQPQTISLHEIIQSLEVPINEEQAWALIHQLVICIQGIKNHTNDPKVYLVTRMRHINIKDDGTIADETFGAGAAVGCRIKTANESTVKTLRFAIISNLGIVIFKALDYGLDPLEERKLSMELEELLDFMTASVENDSEDSINCYEVLKICNEHCRNNNPQTIYTDILKSYVQEGIQLRNFIRVVSSSATDFSEDPSLTNWVKTWTPVVRDFHLQKENIKLRKVEVSVKLPPNKYELTPHEQLMNDIKNDRLKLKKVEVKSKDKEPHREIMDYIRSRPRLRSVEDRVLPPPRKRSLTPIEELLEEIKQEHHLVSVKEGKELETD